jgi:hypothetical protein
VIHTCGTFKIINAIITSAPAPHQQKEHRHHRPYDAGVIIVVVTLIILVTTSVAPPSSPSSIRLTTSIPITHRVRPFSSWNSMSAAVVPKPSFTLGFLPALPLPVNGRSDLPLPLPVNGRSGLPFSLEG